MYREAFFKILRKHQRLVFFGGLSQFTRKDLGSWGLKIVMFDTEQICSNQNQKVIKLFRMFSGAFFKNLNKTPTMSLFQLSYRSKHETLLDKDTTERSVPV